MRFRNKSQRPREKGHKLKSGKVWFSFHFSFFISRGQNRKSPSKSSFCSQTKRKRLLRRLALTMANVCKISRLCESNIFARFGRITIILGKCSAVSIDIRLLVFIKTCKNRATVYWKFSYTTVGKKTVTDGARFMKHTFSCWASSKLSWNISPFSSCFTNSCKLKEKEKTTDMYKIRAVASEGGTRGAAAPPPSWTCWARQLKPVDGFVSFRLSHFDYSDLQLFVIFVMIRGRFLGDISHDKCWK